MYDITQLDESDIPEACFGFIVYFSGGLKTLMLTSSSFCVYFQAQLTLGVPKYGAKKT